MRIAGRFCNLAFLLVALLCACGPRSAPRPSGGPWGMMDFLQAYNAYALAQTYLKRGQHAEAIVEYEQSLLRFARLDDTARTLLREEYGLTQEQVERELALAHALAQKSATAEGNTTEMERFRERVLAGFYPYGRGTLSKGQIRPGAQITLDTWQAAQNLLPPEILQTVSNGYFTILVQETTDLPPGEEYIVATLGYGDKVRLTTDEELEGYTAGLPFPVLDVTDPQAGLKAAWNLRYRDAGDRLEQWSGTLAHDSQSKVQYAFESYFARAFGMYRAKQQYNLPEWEQDGIVSKEYTEIFTNPVAPTGGFSDTPRAGQSLLMLRHRYDSDHRPIGQWFIDAVNRKLKTVAYNPEGSALGFTMILEDVAGSQISAHDWRLVTATVALVPGLIQNSQALFGGIGGGYPLDPWELRRVYVLEMVPRSPHHPYSRKLLYVDQQTFAPFYVVIFDTNNAHWRTVFFSYGHPNFYPDNREVRVPILLGQAWIDYRARRTTVSLVNKALYNQALSPELFTFSGLMQRSK
jgi:hypothetical protein